MTTLEAVRTNAERFREEDEARMPGVAFSLHVPLRVDFGGGWLDVPKFARPGAFIVNCAIEPFDAHPGGGLGGSARAAILAGHDPFESETRIAGWQDAAVITETGLCVWRSGATPVLEAKYNPDFLRGKMALLWTGKPHDTASLVEKQHNLSFIERAGYEAAPGDSEDKLGYLRCGMQWSYLAQRSEGMEPLPGADDKMPGNGATCKYCGSGHGGYALYLFTHNEQRARWLAEMSDQYEVRPIEPFVRPCR